MPGVESTDATSLASASTVGNSNPITVRIQQTNDELTERLKDPIYNISILNNNIKEEDIYIQLASTSVVQACITGINQVEKLANKAYINLKETEEADVHFQRGKKEYEESLKLTFPLLENISQAITDAFKLTVKTTKTLLTGAFIITAGIIATVLIAKVGYRIISTMEIPQLSIFSKKEVAEAVLDNVKSNDIMNNIEDIINNVPITVKPSHMLLIGTVILTTVAVIKAPGFIFRTFIKGLKSS